MLSLFLSTYCFLHKHLEKVFNCFSQIFCSKFYFLNKASKQIWLHPSNKKLHSCSSYSLCKHALRLKFIYHNIIFAIAAYASRTTVNSLLFDLAVFSLLHLGSPFFCVTCNCKTSFSILYGRSSKFFGQLLPENPSRKFLSTNLLYTTKAFTASWFKEF